MLLDGALEPIDAEVSRVRIRLGSVERDVDAFGMPPPRSYGSGPLWWALLEIPASAELGSVPLALLVDRAGERIELDLGRLELVSDSSEPALPAPLAPATIAICMATYEPPRERLGRQLDSIRAQTREDWVCLISDDCSSPESIAAIEAEIAGDERFVLSASPERLGFYRNFERALRMVPDDAELVALADQDDRWDPDKLAALADLLEARPDAALAYSDMRIATDDGRILSETFWYLRRNSHDDIASLLVSNTVTGAASLLRRELLDQALPLPPAHPAHQAYHDHWLALCALALGDIAYLDRPTYDYTRHEESVTIRAQPDWLAPEPGRGGRARVRWRLHRRRLRLLLARPSGRDVYFRRYLLMRQLAVALELRLGDRIEPAKRRAIGRVAEAERSPGAAAWLLSRSLRPLIGRNETLGSERVVFVGLLWRWIVGHRSAARRAG